MKSKDQRLLEEAYIKAYSKFPEKFNFKEVLQNVATNEPTKKFANVV